MKRAFFTAFSCVMLSTLIASAPADTEDIGKLYQSALNSLKNKDTTNAKKALIKLINKGPKAYPNAFAFFDLYLQLIQIEIEGGFFRDAKGHLEKLSAFEIPTEVELAISFCYARLLAKESSASKALEKLNEIKHQLPFADWPQQEKMLHHTISYQQDSALDALLIEADEAFQNRDLPKAWNSYRELIDQIELGLYPKVESRSEIRTHIFFYGGKTLAILGEHAKAIALYSKLIETLQNTSDLVQIRFEGAYSFAKIHNYKSSVIWLEEALKECPPKSPFFLRAISLLTSCALHDQNWQSADKAFRLIEDKKGLIPPSLPNTLWEKIAFSQICFTQLAPDTFPLSSHLESAEKILNRLIKEAPSDALHLKLIRLYGTKQKRLRDQKAGKKLLSLIEKAPFETIQAESDALSLALEFSLDKRLASLLEEKLLDRRFISTKGYQKVHLQKGKRLLEAGKKANNKSLLAQAERHLSVAMSLSQDKKERLSIDPLLQECLSALYLLETKP